MSLLNRFERFCLEKLTKHKKLMECFCLLSMLAFFSAIFFGDRLFVIGFSSMLVIIVVNHWKEHLEKKAKVMAEEIELREESNFGGKIDWRNDDLFFTHVWRDETSQFDNHPSVRWQGGGEYYDREFKARVPIAFRNCEEMVDKFIMMMMDDYPDEKGFWVD